MSVSVTHSLGFSLTHEDIALGESLGIVPYTDKKAFKKFKEATAAYELELKRQEGLDKRSKSPVALMRLQRAIPVIADLRDPLTEECRVIYENARRSPVPFVLGGASLRASDPHAVSIMCNFGVLAGEKNQVPHQVRSHRFSDGTGVNLESGGVLCDGSWSVFKNDCAILGIIHSGRTCYISREKAVDAASMAEAHEESDDIDLSDELWDETESRPKVLGREIAMLSAAGYAQVASCDQAKEYGHMFVPQIRETLSGVTLAQLMAQASKIGSVETLEELLVQPEERARTASTVTLDSARLSPVSFGSERGSPLSLLEGGSMSFSNASSFAEALGGGAAKGCARAEEES